MAFSTRLSAEGEVTTPGSSTPPAPPLPDGRAATLRRWGPIPLAAGAVVLGAGVVLGLLTIGPNLGTPPDATSSGSPATGAPRETADANPTPTPAPSATAPATSGTWTATGNMLTPRGSHTATLLTDGRVLVAGGYNDYGDGAGGDMLASAELYDPATGSWVATGSMTVARVGHTATLLADGRVLVVGGTSAPPSAELYDPRSGTWTATGNLVHVPVDEWPFHAAVLLADGMVLVAGGPPGSMVRSTPAEVYDPRSGSWTAIESMAVGRYRLTLTRLLDGTVLAAGGARVIHDPVTDIRAERYDPASGFWTDAGDMVEARGAGHAATLLPDGRLLVIGGMYWTGDPSGSSAELYDPEAGSWTAAGRLNEPRAEFTATLLPDGTVLIVGGTYADALATPELYDPATGSSTTTAGMVETRLAFHTATLLLDGTVLVTGGLGSGCCQIASAELFHP